MKSVKERQDEARKRKLEEFQEQIDSGSLVVRQMTKAERKRFPPKNRGSKRR